VDISRGNTAGHHFGRKYSLTFWEGLQLDILGGNTAGHFGREYSRTFWEGLQLDILGGNTAGHFGREYSRTFREGIQLDVLQLDIYGRPQLIITKIFRLEYSTLLPKKM